MVKIFSFNDQILCYEIYELTMFDLIELIV